MKGGGREGTESPLDTSGSAYTAVTSQASQCTSALGHEATFYLNDMVRGEKPQGNELILGC